MKRLLFAILACAMLLTTPSPAQFWQSNNVKFLSGWLNATSAAVTYDTTLDSVLYVNLGSLPANAFILSVSAYTLDGWNATGHGGPADSICVGYSGDLDAILDEASCAAAGLDNTLVAASMINNPTDGNTDYGMIKGFYRITSNGNYRAAGKTYFVVTYVEGISEP